MLAAVYVTAVIGNDSDKKRSPAADRTAAAKREEILAEIKRIGLHSWAGDYYAGDGHNLNLFALAPKAGYLFEWHGCLGLYDRNYGSVTAIDRRLRLSFTFANTQLQGIAPELIVVPWGGRKYLIPAEDIIRFCNSVNLGREPRSDRYGLHLLRRGDEQTKVIGFPDLPAKYRDYLLAKPVDATIVAVGQPKRVPGIGTEGETETPLTLDAGTNHGLRAGMELVVIRPASLYESVRVTTLTDDRASAVLRRFGGEKDRPEVGWQLSTRLPWHGRKGQ
jgi:hypothetical protein